MTTAQRRAPPATRVVAGDLSEMAVVLHLTGIFKRDAELAVAAPVS